MKQKISKNEYLQLLGLKTLIVEYNKKLSDIHTTICDIMEDGDDDGWISDFIYDENATVDSFLNGLKVEKL